MSSVSLITVGITCFNAASTIGRALQCAKEQDWPEKEIVVVDDGSSDRSAEIIREFSARSPEIKFVRHEGNRGYPAALNSIVQNASGEFIAFFDDDDVSRPDRLRKQYHRIANYKAAVGGAPVLCYSNRDVVRAGETISDHVALAIGREPPEPNGPLVAGYLLGYHSDTQRVWGMFGSCTLMARRDTFRAVGPFDETFRRSAEWDFAVRAALMSGHFIAVNEPLVTQYKTATADKSGDTPLRFALKLRRKHKDHLTSERAYLASRAMARVRFHGNNGSKWRARLNLAWARALLWYRHLLKNLSASMRDR